MGKSIYRMGVDIGGTFTDFALYDETARTVSIHKRLTTPQDPARAVIEGVQSLLADAAVSVADVAAVVHGTTLVTNAVIERCGAKTGMLVTAGFGDLLDMGLETRYDLFDLRLAFPAPLVPRALRREVNERVRHDGSVERPLDGARALDAAAELIEGAGVEALAVCLLHAYANPSHEEAIGATLATEFPDVAVSCSAAVLPRMREYERWTTTTMNAYVQPMFRALPGPTRHRPRRPRVHRSAVHHDVRWRHADAGDGTPFSGTGTRIRPRRRRPHVRLSRARARAVRASVLRYGWDHRQRGADSRPYADP